MGPQPLIGEVFSNAARAVPGRTAVVHEGRSLDFATVEAQGNRLARRLDALGIGAGARVASWCSTTLDAVPLFAALAKLGALFVPLSGLLGPGELEELLLVARPDLVVVDEAHAGRARRLPGTVTGVESLLEDSRGLDDARLPPPPGLVGADPHVAFLTSGSTGRPKGVVLSHQANWLRSHPGALLERRGAMVCPYPLFHMGAWTIALQQWQARDAVVLVPADAGAICEAVQASGATRLNCVPAVWRRLLDQPGHRASTALASLRFADTGTSATPPELLEAMADLLPDAHRRVFYGSTEAGTVTCLEDEDMARKPGSCGVPAPGVQVRLADDGEVWVRTTTLFDGYLDDAEATAAALVDDWYRTGDLGELDDEGYLSIVGRAGELIRTGGESVAPSEVEAVLLELPEVADVAVVGVPDGTWGEVVCAVIVPSGPVAPGAEEVRAHCRGRLAGYKHPRRVEVTDAIPRTAATGQVQRRLLLERLLGP